MLISEAGSHAQDLLMTPSSYRRHLGATKPPKPGATYSTTCAPGPSNGHAAHRAGLADGTVSECRLHPSRYTAYGGGCSHWGSSIGLTAQPTEGVYVAQARQPPSQRGPHARCLFQRQLGGSERPPAGYQSPRRQRPGAACAVSYHVLAAGCNVGRCSPVVGASNR